MFYWRRELPVFVTYSHCAIALFRIHRTESPRRPMGIFCGQLCPPPLIGRSSSITFHSNRSPVETMSSYSVCPSCATTVQLDLVHDCDFASFDTLSEHSVYTVSSTEMNDFSSRSSSPDEPNYRFAYQVERASNLMLIRAKTALEATVIGLERDLQLERARYALLVPQEEEGR